MADGDILSASGLTAESAAAASPSIRPSTAAHIASLKTP